MICSKCGKELKAHSKFCSYCGTAIQKEEEFQSEKSSGVSSVREQQKLLIILFSVIIVGVIVAFIGFSIHIKNKQPQAPQQLDNNVTTEDKTSEATQQIKETTEEKAKVVDSTEENTTIAKYMYVDNVSQAIYLRKKPVEKDGNEIETIPLGTQIGFIEKSNDTYSKINYNGKIGYVKTSYLSELKPDITVKYPMYVVNVNESVTLRRDPSTTGEAVCKIPLEEEVGFIEDTNSLFTKVRYGDRVGYVMSQYLSNSMPNTVISEWMYIDNVSKAIKLRKNPTDDSDSYFDLSLGTEVGFIENVNSVYAKINYNGTIGYTKWEYLSYSRPNTTVSETMYITNVDDSAYFRLQPTEDTRSSNIICTIPLYEDVGFIEDYDGDFAKIKYNGRIGYVKWEVLSGYDDYYYY